MTQILLFGAGKSATVLIQYLLAQCELFHWQLALVDANHALAQSKIAGHACGTAYAFDIKDEEQRKRLVQESSLVISLLPPALHLLVAKDCIAAGKNLFTASYVDAEMEALRPQIDAKGLFFLCEMGLDPGIDHMSAKRLLDRIAAKGGKVVSFISHCGGLVAKDSDDNPWHYKISWNPRNVVHAGKDGAIFRDEGETVQWDYPELFAEKRYVEVQNETYCCYPNRDSLRYLPIYGLEDCPTFIRTTLRHPDFMMGWKNIIELDLTNTDPVYQTDGMSLQAFFQMHFKSRDFDGWLTKKLDENLHEQQSVFHEINDQLAQGDDNKMEAIQMEAAEKIKALLYESGLLLDQLSWLGVKDNETIINRELCSAADVLQFALEQKLALQPGDRDLVVMLHEIGYTLGDDTQYAESALVLKGKDDVHTAMAATVGLPLGIAAVLTLQGKLNLKGLHIPVLPQIYEPVLNELEKHGIRFEEQ